MKIGFSLFRKIVFGASVLGVVFNLGACQSWAIQEPASLPPPAQGAPPAATLSQDQLQQLVAPIALYPDALVAQILAASAYPTQIVVANRFVQGHPNLSPGGLAAEVDKQDWDPSVKALTQYPSVLADMDKNLAWTSELGDANYNQQANLMAAVQTMRQKAETAGTLKTTPQQTVTNQGSSVVIQPVNPTVVYVPVYDPAVVYGYPVALWPGFYPWWVVGAPYVSFGIGFGLGPFIGFGWAWRGWGMDWHHEHLMYAGGPYAFHSRSFYNRAAYFHGGYRGPSSFARGDRGLRGYGAPGTRSNNGLRSGALGEASHGADARGNSFRGRSSFSGGGEMGHSRGR